MTQFSLLLGLCVFARTALTKRYKQGRRVLAGWVPSEDGEEESVPSPSPWLADGRVSLCLIFSSSLSECPFMKKEFGCRHSGHTAD